MPAVRTVQNLDFIDINRFKALTRPSSPYTPAEISAVLTRARKLKGLTLEEAAVLLSIQEPSDRKVLMETAEWVKNEIYGKRMVLFAPLYTGNVCANNCLYCGFRRDNRELNRINLDEEQIRQEVTALLKEGHKRLLMLCGESASHPLEKTLRAVRAAYAAEYEGSRIRRINVEIAPMETDEFRLLKEENIGTYICFQETYDPELYRIYHPSGPKADYQYRLEVMHRAMEAGLDDVGIGALFGLADHRTEVLSLLAHARNLEEHFGCGPHTVSVPRLEPAPGSPLSSRVPCPVSDDDFAVIIAVLRLSLPYTGIILSTREPEVLRRKLFAYGVSQISAGSRTNPGGYSGDKGGEDNSQFSLGDHRSLEEVISGLVDEGFIPSFCTGCYRNGRVGRDFMDLAKPGLIKSFCLPNGLTSFAEYLHDFAGDDLKSRGFSLIESLTADIPREDLRETVTRQLSQLTLGKRDLYL